MLYNIYTILYFEIIYLHWAVCYNSQLSLVPSLSESLPAKGDIFSGVLERVLQYSLWIFSWHLYDREFWILLVFVCTLSPPRLSRHFHRDDRLLFWLCARFTAFWRMHVPSTALSQHSSISAPSLPGPCSVLPRKPASHFILWMLPRTHLQCPDYKIHSFIYLFYIWKDLVVESPAALAESVVDKQNVLYCPLAIVAHT